MEYEQPGDWVMRNRWPAMVMVPVREGPLVAITSKGTSAEPFPFGSVRTTIQLESDSVLHVQRSLEARTPILPDPPSPGNEADVASSAIEHSPAACVRSARCPFTTTAPRRTTGSGLRTVASSTVPLPCPLAPDLMLSHDDSVDADHAHSRAADTATVAEPASAGTSPPPSSATPQRVNDDGEVTVVVEDPQAAASKRAQQMTTTAESL
jgi:hypothetical protein